VVLWTFDNLNNSNRLGFVLNIYFFSSVFVNHFSAIQFFHVLILGQPETETVSPATPFKELISAIF
jgi:hypothetical protein